MGPLLVTLALAGAAAAWLTWRIYRLDSDTKGEHRDR